MSAPPPPIDRKLIPRWRAAFQMISGREGLSDKRSPEELSVYSKEFDSKLAAWLAAPGLETAGEAVLAAIVANAGAAAFGPAEFLLSNKASPTDALRDLARKVRHGSVEGSPVSSLDTVQDVERDRYKNIAVLRQRVREDSSDILSWLDLSLSYTNIGETVKAVKAIEVALGLGGSRRIVLRPATRLFVHVGDAERALVILRRSPSLASDPWIMSAEISVAEMMGKSNRNLEKAERFLRNNLDKSWMVSELAGAIATTYLKKGSKKTAKTLFDISLRDPTDNAVAQAVWAGREWKVQIGTSIDLIHRTDAFEARALKAYREADWEVCVRELDGWLKDEPFSARPAILGSFIASTFLKDYEVAKSFACRGLSANPTSFFLRNNLAYSLAFLGDTQSARRELGSLPTHNEDTVEGYTGLATRGLIEIMDCNYSLGRACYDAALAKSFDMGRYHSGDLLRLHYLRAEMRCQSPDRHRMIAAMKSIGLQHPTVENRAGERALLAEMVLGELAPFFPGDADFAAAAEHVNHVLQLKLAKF